MFLAAQILGAVEISLVPWDTSSIPDISLEAASPDTCFCNHCPIITHSIIQIAAFVVCVGNQN